MLIRYTAEEFDRTKSTDCLKLECEFCGKKFYAPKKAIKYEVSHTRGNLKYCSVKCSIDSQKKKHKVNCQCCGKEIEVVDCLYKASKTKHFFCNHSCAAKYNNKRRGSVSEETRQKIKKSLLNHYKALNKPLKTFVCKTCGKEFNKQEDNGFSKKFCSKECFEHYRKNKKNFISEDTIVKLSAAGRHSAEVQSKTRRSKNEEYFCKLCEEYFQNVKHNEPLFNGWDADVIIEDIKVAVLWNGKWHYQKLKDKHSVEQVQNRDKIKLNEITRKGYTPYIIKDMGKFNPQFVKNEFDKFLKTL